MASRIIRLLFVPAESRHRRLACAEVSSCRDPIISFVERQRLSVRRCRFLKAEPRSIVVPAMIRLHYSNRLENLIAPLAEAVAAHQRRDPLERVSIVVPNRVVEQFVRYRLAESIGVAANLKFPFLRSYLADLLQSTDKNLKILEDDELQLVLF